METKYYAEVVDHFRLWFPSETFVFDPALKVPEDMVDDALRTEVAEKSSVLTEELVGQIFKMLPYKSQAADKWNLVRVLCTLH